MAINRIIRLDIISGRLSIYHQHSTNHWRKAGKPTLMYITPDGQVIEHFSPQTAVSRSTGNSAASDEPAELAPETLRSANTSCTAQISRHQAGQLVKPSPKICFQLLQRLLGKKGQPQLHLTTTLASQRHRTPAFRMISWITDRTACRRAMKLAKPPSVWRAPHNPSSSMVEYLFVPILSFLVCSSCAT